MAKPTLVLSMTGATCSDGAISFNSTTAGLKYDYNLGGLYTNTVPPATYTTVVGTNTINGLVSGIYSVRLHNLSSGCYSDTFITVTKLANCAPVAVNNSAVTGEGTSVILTNITSNDNDIDGSIILSTIDLNPITSGIQTTFSNASGSWAVDGSGNVTYTPPSSTFNGLTTIQYVVSDNSGAISNNATLTVQLNPNAPTGTNAARCGSGAISLSATKTNSGTFRWYSAASGGSSLFSESGVTTSTYSPTVASTTKIGRAHV